MKPIHRSLPTTSLLALALTTFSLGCRSTTADGSGGNGADVPDASAPGNGGGGSTAEVDASDEPSFECQIPDVDSPPDFLDVMGCEADFNAFASEPLSNSLPGARAVKTVFDRDYGPADDLAAAPALYFQNSKKYLIHYEFASEHLSVGQGFPVVGSLAEFNQTEYQSSLRRFVLGSLTHYEGPDVWVYELSPYDTADADMIQRSYEAIKAKFFRGEELAFHPTSESIEAVAEELPDTVPILSTDELYAGIDYQPLSLGEVVGTLRFVKAVDLETDYVTSRDIVLLDSVPNDITPVAGIITEEFQTPLSHINVLAQSRGTPNMGLRDARNNPMLAPLIGKYVRLTVGAFDFTAEEVTVEEANAWFEDHKPEPVTVELPDLSVRDLRDIEDVTEHTDEAPYVTLEAIQTAIRAFGGKAANYSVFSTDPEIPSKKAFAIPVYYYDQYMRENGFFDRVAALREDPDFVGDSAVRDEALSVLRDDIKAAPFSDEFRALLEAKLDDFFPGVSVRFRSSTNGEDLDGFPCAGCYDSKTGDPADPEFEGDQLEASLQAIRKVYATVFSLRTYDERELHGIPHDRIAMALLVHTNFPDEEANGVAATDNITDRSGNTPGFYVNAQFGGEYEVVHPPAGVTSDSFLYLNSFVGQPIIYISHSNQVPEGEHVLTDEQIHELGAALAKIQTRFRNAYGSEDGSWWALEVDFKFDDEDTGGDPMLFIKQARPYPVGR